METGSHLPRDAHKQVAGGSAEERYYMASQWKLMWRKFRKHKLAVMSLVVLSVFYMVALTHEFWAPYGPLTQHDGFLNAAPTRVRLFDSDGKFRGLFAYGVKGTLDMKTFKRVYEEDTSRIYPIHFFVRGDPYRFWGRFKTDLHFFGSERDGRIFLLGTDRLGRDLFSRVLSGGRISLTIGLVGVSISFILGCLLGGISGFYGGTVDLIIQRGIEFLQGIPNIPLWMALSAAVPARWSPVQTYFAITIILSIVGWTGLARVVRGRLLELREHDFVKAAQFAGASDLRIIADHLLPGFMSYLIVNVTLSVPGMILAETSLSFLGLGMQAPAISWGTLLQDAQNIRSIAITPWMLTPALFVIITVLLFNFAGDGLRDAADPYK